jgi:hypothetical protein
MFGESYAAKIYADLNRVSTAVPSSDLADFRSFTSSASSWWAAHSSMIPDTQEQCPDSWENAKMDFPAGEIWLNATIALADCEDGEKAAANAPAAAVSAPASASASAAVLASAPATGDASLMAKINAVGIGLAVGAISLL